MTQNSTVTDDWMVEILVDISRSTAYQRCNGWWKDPPNLCKNSPHLKNSKMDNEKALQQIERTPDFQCLLFVASRYTWRSFYLHSIMADSSTWKARRVTAWVLLISQTLGHHRDWNITTHTNVPAVLLYLAMCTCCTRPFQTGTIQKPSDHHVHTSLVGISCVC